MSSNLDSIEHIVLLMLENRSFDHMLGWLYADQGNRSPLGHTYEGLTGAESNPGSDGQPVTVFRITPQTLNAYFMPGVNPGESYLRRTFQLFGQKTAPAKAPPAARSNQWHVQDFAQRIKDASSLRGNHYIPDTVESSIMGCYAPETLPVLSALAKGYAVCDQWFASVPSETMPNRAFALAGTSLGQVDDPYGQKQLPTYNTTSIFGRLAEAGKQWRIYGCGRVLTMTNFPDTVPASEAWRKGSFTDFKNAARNGTLPEFTLIEPAWGSGGAVGQNDQHPISDVSAGEQLLADVYDALSNGTSWNSTLLVITYDESGGCYDHVPPPWGGAVVAPDGHKDAKTGFDFTRLGPRVPAVLVSPWIRAGTVFQAPVGAPPIDHTVVLKTIETRWGLKPLTARDAAACDLGGALTLSAPRTDNPLLNVQVPHYDGPDPFAADVTHLQSLHADALEAHPAVRDDKTVSKQRPANSLDFVNYMKGLEQHIRQSGVDVPTSRGRGNGAARTGKGQGRKTR